MLLLFSVAALICSANGLLFGLIGTDQSAAVKGRLLCNGAPAANIRVKLYEKEATIDRLMEEGTTDEDGNFHLSGTKVEVSTIDPRLNIYHRCNYDGILSTTCYKKVGITIPDNFVSEGKVPQKIFDIGEINLAGKYSGESTDCFN